MKKLITLLFVLVIFTTTAQENYYNDVNLNLTGLTLKNALATKIISTHTRALNYTPDIWEASKITDVNPENSNQVLLIYGYSNSGTTSRTRDINNNGGGNGYWNREHVFANSLANPKLSSSGTNAPPYADAFNLRPCDSQINSSRGNKKFALGSGNSGTVSGGWYPGDEWKGDVARTAMYMYLRYGAQCLPTFLGNGNTENTPDDMIDLFLQWNAEDPVSAIEKKRNTYHEDTNNPYAQGNRNPFIDNPILATRIWGGPKAEDIWGIYTNNDSEAPTTPTNVTISNITTKSINVSWEASTDNIGVSSYEVFSNSNFYASTSNTNITINNLLPNTQYNIQIKAKDLADNASPKTTPKYVTTLVDNQPPTTPKNITINNQTKNSFIVRWNIADDNTKVTGYNLYINNNLINNTTTNQYTVTNLTASTTYAVQVSAFDSSNNESTLSNIVNATTTDGSASNANELFISEYIEGSANNKAIEIANITSNPINLSGYSLKRNSNGGTTWSSPLNLSGSIAAGDVYVLINQNANIQKLIDEADFAQPNNQNTNYGEPLNFNGNDPIGLFKDNVLIDIIGTFNGGSENFAKDKTLRRKSSVTTPNITFDLSNEWNTFPKNTVDDIGKHNVATASYNNLTKSNAIIIYPNPLKTKRLFFKTSSNNIINSVQFFSALGKEVYYIKGVDFTNGILISDLKKGIYFIKIRTNHQVITKKIILQ